MSLVGPQLPYQRIFGGNVMLGILLILVVADLQAGDWPQFRGPHRDGVSPERISWPPKLLWTTKVGQGHASVIIADEVLYAMGWSGKMERRGRGKGEDVVSAFDARSGKQLWRQTYPAPGQPRFRKGDTGRYCGPHGTPAWDKETGYLYTLGSDGDLRCWNTAEKGKQVWAINLYDKYGMRQRPKTGGGVRDFGYTGSPMLVGNWVVVETGGKAGSLAAFDKQTGRIAWSSRHKGWPGHTPGPVPMTVDGKSALGVLTLKEFLVVSLDKGHEGTTLATIPWKTDFGCNIPAPAASGDAVLITSAYNHKHTRLHKVSAGGAKRVWESRAHSMVSCPLLHGQRAYIISKSLICLDARNGKTLWSGGRFGHGSALMTKGGRLLVHGAGKLTLIDATASAYRELGSIKTIRRAEYPQLALSDGILACKGRDGHLAVYDVRPSKVSAQGEVGE